MSGLNRGCVRLYVAWLQLLLRNVNINEGRIGWAALPSLLQYAARAITRWEGSGRDLGWSLCARGADFSSGTALRTTTSHR
jgi:hypothetical protein